MTTAINERSRASIDIFRGAVLPEDVPQEQIDRLLVLGHIEPETEQRSGSPANPESDGAGRPQRSRRKQAE